MCVVYVLAHYSECGSPPEIVGGQGSKGYQCLHTCLLMKHSILFWGPGILVALIKNPKIMEGEQKDEIGRGDSNLMGDQSWWRCLLLVDDQI
jgi:hypothetical protein